MPKEPMGLLQGTLDVLILRALADGPTHGYAISRWVRDRTRGTLQIEDAPLYKALRRLELADYVDAHWGASENNRRARFYSLTPKGRRRMWTPSSGFTSSRAPQNSVRRAGRLKTRVRRRWKSSAAWTMHGGICAVWTTVLTPRGEGGAT
jgi:PadR family transcriptional regulator, regulatory protein PadR